MGFRAVNQFTQGLKQEVEVEVASGFEFQVSQTLEPIRFLLIVLPPAKTISACINRK